MHSLVLIPDGKISWGKLSQSLDYGALTCQLRTDFDGCVRILNELVRQKPVYLLNSVNPYRIEGQKTAAIELMEQLEWEPPDHIIVPGGNLGNSSAIGKALLEMRELKLISRLPKLSIIQAHGANPFYSSVRLDDGKLRQARDQFKLTHFEQRLADRGTVSQIPPRDDDVVRRFPRELLHEFDGGSFLAFDAIRIHRIQQIDRLLPYE